jgi:hypothetical protein
MDPKFEALAVYNAERARGLVHTAEYDLRMAVLQAEFDGRPLLSDYVQVDADKIRAEHPGRVVTR